MKDIDIKKFQDTIMRFFVFEYIILSYYYWDLNPKHWGIPIIGF